ncbi:MAG TPA: 16S rRNA (guanine(966)-N(2))-methyltransferase RsmD, partial [Firmicutes bacterium]|nr:16S rRNA (guanine(966)-N(2))-methyltransferase RsmD [Bacillota bacterium]
MLKIIGGKYRSRIIATPSIETVPTKNIVREALFSAVSFDLDGNTLDLFAGSGAIGIEALSRGAKKSYFVDKSISSCKIIESNLKTLKEDNGIILNMDYMDALKKLNEENVSFSFIYIDPP